MSLTKLYESFETKMESLFHTEIQFDRAKSPGMRREKLSPKPSGFLNPLERETVSLEETLDDLLKPLKNPLLKYGQGLFLFNQDLPKNDFIKHNLTNMVFTPEHILYVIKKRVEFTFDEYPLLNDENKEAQRNLVPVLNEFCTKFSLNLFNVPST